jgi:hypothetical protein
VKRSARRKGPRYRGGKGKEQRQRGGKEEERGGKSILSSGDWGGGRDKYRGKEKKRSKVGASDIHMKWEGRRETDSQSENYKQSFGKGKGKGNGKVFHTQILAKDKGPIIKPLSDRVREGSKDNCPLSHNPKNIILRQHI